MRAAFVTAAVTALALPLSLSGPATAQQGFQDPVLKENTVKPVTPHVSVLMGFPNIGFVVGDKAVLVVDTGLGDRNGAVVAREAAKLATKGQKLILTTTHFHPEHAAGQGGFPAGTTVIRPKVQQAELEADGPRLIALFAGRNATMKALLEGAKPGRADIVFDREHDLDLGGVHVRLYAFGPAHTQGDEIVYVEEDRTILPGDVVENRISPNITCDACSPRKWIEVLDQIEPLQPLHVVPDHGELGSGALVGQERAFLTDLQARATALKAQGKSADEAAQLISAEFMTRYKGWSGLGNVAASVKKAYADPG
jgi:glyoxylase-like metal-dependent hydrolase (beta-lactamase superfamily II)